jgi:hypothetical protein
MPEYCDNLPSLIKLEENSDDYKAFVNSSYKKYLEIIDSADFKFRGLPIQTDRDLNYNLQHRGFDHVTTKDTLHNKRNKHNYRLYNNKRIERVSWIKTLVLGTNCNCDNYRVFGNVRDNKARTLIWCVREDYLIVLERRKTSYFLITAYCIYYDDARKEILKDYENYQNTKTPII